jgi:Asp-tRNA(Asn)/Glu-tRNA(Gln) amidotransferase A subunit family amidase
MIEEAVLFAPVSKLADLVRAREISPVELTRSYLERLHRIDRGLRAVITFTDDAALVEANEAEKEIARGSYRGPLHGIPYGVKDLLDTRGVPTTWGIGHHRTRVPGSDATVVERLRAAGAVLIAKLSMGELARGATWFGGTTRCPWDLSRSSGGSSAGSGAATAAGGVGFSIGSETFGSILSPSSACGVSGLRPTYGRVSRAGAMPLSWSIDKVGPICRSAHDCALVLGAIHGEDPRDPSTVDAPFRWEPDDGVRGLRVGVVEGDFDAIDNPGVEAASRDVLPVLESLGVKLTAVELPDYPYSAVYECIRGPEAALAFEDLIDEGRLDTLVNDGPSAWKNIFPVARLTPAVHYLKAQQIRALMQADAERLMRDVDALVAPGGGPAALLNAPPPPAAAGTGPRAIGLGNFTGQPAIGVPAGFVEGLPVGIQFIGRSWEEGTALRLAHAYQQVTDWHLRYPVL